MLQEVSNSLAKLAVRACARLGGYLPDDDVTPDNPAVKKSLGTMLTPYVAKKLSQNTPAEVSNGKSQTLKTSLKMEKI